MPQRGTSKSTMLNLKRSNECPICGGAMEHLIDLPRFPLTEMYEPHTDGFDEGRGIVDQSFQYCCGCSHGKLGTVVPPETLYAKDYRTKTSKSVGAAHSVRSFYDFLHRHLDFGNFETVIDIGGNDGSLANLFRKKRVVVDPHGAVDDGLVLRDYVEKADLIQFKAERKLIVSSHTLEHLEKPEVLLEKVQSIFCYGDTLAMQFPSLDYLVKDARIDQVHHQHVHYFSLRSTSLLLAKYGFEMTQFAFDPDHYGTLQVIARRGLEELKGVPIFKRDLIEAHVDFTRGMKSFDAAIERLREPIGYGAALMLPVLAYYAPAVNDLICIADEDASKQGQRYINLNVPITAPPDLRGRDVAVTAFNTKMAVRKITSKLTNEGARTVVVPFNAL